MLLQIAYDSTAQVANATASQDSLSLLSLIMKGGWIMVPILALSVVAVFLIIERFIVIKQASNVDPNFMRNIKEFLLAGKMDSALAMCKSTNTPIARLLEKGLKRLGKPIKEIESAVENTGKLEIYKLERNLGYIGIIAAIAPMFGFVGTISGVIKIFYNISLADNISIGIIAGGLYEKMITTAAGLIVGIIAHIGFHFLNTMIDRVSFQLETTAVDFIDILQEPAK
ncbi:MAG: MotA/TolQ/ExbB proton channel family protein [Chitinophagales bacterium]|nr:MotA/TolQ/ExbB proton channel family protein [Chitinophagales bacterium]MCO5280477.1 MotA/TolQ/ExbB proton channel family protein [Chitinophagales bacterium]OJV26813.1 MAG: biopolymer transporter ExbB [Bacteroidetes bacterium 37-13]HRN94233.1 MotA/TolQ/ExbB proton channel family protein [Chitinophagales bacterium]HRP40126.1 MotA/TolQ/ExbB proton channel family protein [Chitinophagales bacterium]